VILMTISDSVINEFRKILTQRRNQQHIVIFIFIMILLAGVFWHATENTQTKGEAGDYMISNVWDTSVEEESEFTDEGTHDDFERTLPKGIAIIEIALTWRDEADQSATHDNEPDGFYFEVMTPWGDKWESEHRENSRDSSGGTGTITLTQNMSANENITQENKMESRTDGIYSISVFCEYAGDQEDSIPPPIGSNTEDPGNQWTCNIRYKSWKERPGTGEE